MPYHPIQAACNHTELHFEPSPHIIQAGYKPRTAQTLKRASALPSAAKREPGIISCQRNNNNGIENNSSASFPAPLVLPNDELACDPKCPGQTVSSWVKLDERNPVTKEREVLYVAAPPDIDEEVAFLRKDIEPVACNNSNNLGRDGQMKKTAISTSRIKNVETSLYPTRPSVQDIVEYLSAFYKGIPVKLLPKLRFTPWDEENRRQKQNYQHVALASDTEAVRISRRERPGVFSNQLDLNDLLDAATGFLPSDAYALLLIVDHDIFEDDDDDFACGRAYGGSRVAVVSTARYNPVLDADDKHQVSRDHPWPVSHCKEYIVDTCSTFSITTDQRSSKRPKLERETVFKHKQQKHEDSGSLLDSPMYKAISAYTDLPRLPSTTMYIPGMKSGGENIDRSTTDSALSGLWLGRVCRTASHELGHCFGIDHCVYYSCAMQGTASLSEDERQPPYLCPVDLMKVLLATGQDIVGYYKGLLQVCTKHSDVHLFAAYAGWLRGRLAELTDEYIENSN